MTWYTTQQRTVCEALMVCLIVSKTTLRQCSASSLSIMVQAWRHVVATCQAVKEAQQQARQAHLQDIATTFHLLFRQHSVMQAWHTMSQRTKHERTQTQQAAAEQQRDQAKWAAAVQFHGLYTQHSFWRCWVEVTQQGRIEKELDLQHQTRQHNIRRFVKVSPHFLFSHIFVRRAPVKFPQTPCVIHS